MKFMYLRPIIAAAAAATLSACGTQGASSSAIRADYDKSTGRLTRLSHDSDGNGKVDTVATMDGSRVVKVEADEDENGTVDRWEYYAASSDENGTQRDVLERVERSTKRDGRINRWEFFEGGKLSRVNEDTNGDGKVDKWEQYVDGTLSVLLLDTQSRGTADRKLVYGPDGNLDHIEVDPGGTGRFERLKP